MNVSTGGQGQETPGRLGQSQQGDQEVGWGCGS